MRNYLFFRVLLAVVVFLPTAVLAQADTAPTEPPNYAHAPGMHGLLHWAHFPIHVYFTPGPAATVAAQKAARDGFTEWVRATGSVVRYEVVTDPARADLSVTILPDPFLPNQSGVMGTTSVVYSDDVLKKVMMQIASGGATSEEMQTCAAHEFGHALGINGHSDNQDDLMYPSEIRLIALDGTPVEMPPRPVSARDLNTLKIGYGPLWAQLAAQAPPVAPKG